MATTSRTNAHTWDKTRQAHTCCGSKAAWRHKRGCPKNEGDGRLPPDGPTAIAYDRDLEKQLLERDDVFALDAKAYLAATHAAVQLALRGKTVRAKIHPPTPKCSTCGDTGEVRFRDGIPAHPVPCPVIHR